MKIFISYCHDDIPASDRRLDVLAHALQYQDDLDLEVLLDRGHGSAAIGSSLPRFMKNIDTADAVILLLTPGYRQRVDEKRDTGVYYEFRRVYDRLLRTEERKQYGREYVVLPIVFSGSFAQSCPQEVRHLVSRDLSWLHVTPSPANRKHAPGDTKLRAFLKANLHKALRLRFEQFLEETVGRLAAIATTRRPAFRAQQEHFVRQLLFHETKSKLDKKSHLSHLEATFVKTKTFLRARDRDISLVIGRKGSGKSTLADVLPLYAMPRPTVVLRIEFEQLPFQLCLNVLQLNPASRSDLRYAFSALYSYQLLWDAFFHLCCAWTLREKLPKRSPVRTLLSRLLKDAVARATQPHEEHAIVTRVLFVHAFERLVGFLDRLIGRKGGNDELAPAVGLFTPTSFRREVFGDTGWESVNRAIAAVGPGKKVLVTADGFDTISGYFPVETEKEAHAVSDFEREVLLALMLVVLNEGPGRVFGGPLYDSADFLIAVPHDRFQAIKEIDRDRYRFRTKVGEIAWSGIELSALVRKRLAVLRNVADPRGAPLEDRLARVMAVGFAELPRELTFQFASAPYRMPLFLYVLRHTFWRPRDVLFYYAILLAAAETFQKSKTEMTTAFARQLVAGATHYVVEDEFIDEFSGTFRNLRDVIHRFREKAQILSWPNLVEVLDPIRFDTRRGGGEEPNTLASKIEVLYEMGFLGVLLDEQTAKRLSAHRHSFIFNEGTVIPDRIRPDGYRELRYIIHPVFVETLHLDTSGNDELILPLDWEYLHRNEALRGALTAY